MWKSSARVLALALLVGALAAPGAAQTSPDPVEASVAASFEASERMLVGVTLAGAGPYPFIVDTAAESSVIAQELAQQLALKRAGRARMLALTGSRDIGKVEIPDLSFLPGRSHRVHAFALRGEHIGASGVIGIDALQGQRVVLDFQNRALRVGPAPPRREAVAGPDEIIVRARRRFGQLVLADVTLDGAPIDVIIDSGSEASIGNDALRRLLTTRRNSFRQITLVSVTGEAFAADYTQTDRLTIGSVQVTGLPVAFANAPFFSRMKLTRQPAMLLGMDALRMFDRVTVDFPNRRATFVVPASTRTSS